MAKYRVITPVRPAPALADNYRAKLDGTLAQLRKEIILPFLADIPAPPVFDMAFDASRYDAMLRSFQERFWNWANARGAQNMALSEWFGFAASRHAGNALKQNIARAIGQPVRLVMSPALEATVSGVVRNNVQLIRSIHTVYAEEVVGLVMESVKAGRDLGTLTDALEERYGIARSRARLIALDQNNKATSAIDRQRKLDNGIRQSKWIHTGAGKVPRPSHKAANNKIYDVEKGMLIDGKYIHPGEEINCHCISAAVISVYGGTWDGKTGVAA